MKLNVRNGDLCNVLGFKHFAELRDKSELVIGGGPYVQRYVTHSSKLGKWVLWNYELLEQTVQFDTRDEAIHAARDEFKALNLPAFLWRAQESLIPSIETPEHPLPGHHIDKLSDDWAHDSEGDSPLQPARDKSWHLEGRKSTIKCGCGSNRWESEEMTIDGVPVLRLCCVACGYFRLYTVLIDSGSGK